MGVLTQACVALCGASLLLTGCNPAKEAPKAPTPSATPQATATPVALRAPTKDEEIVFAHLDLAKPELAAVADAVKRGDYDAASHAWAVYLKDRKDPHWNTTGGKYDRQVADDAVNGKVQGGQVTYVYAFPEGKINWYYNATAYDPGQSYNSEWQWQLNRMAFWGTLGNAYVDTKDERYPKAFAAQLRSWIDQCPVPATAKEGNKNGSTWRTIEAGIRMGFNWPNAFFKLLPGLTDADIVAFTRSTYDHANYLRHNATNVNWVLMEMNGLSVAGCYFPEFRDAADWRAYAFSKFASEAKEQFLPDGAQYELSTGYHTDVVLTNFVAGLNNAIDTGHQSEVSLDYVKALEKGFEWPMFLATPDKGRPTKNDSWPGSIQYAMKNAAKFFPERQDFKWFATNGKEGQPPEKTSVFLDWSGQIVERSGWETDANYLIFNVGPLGFGGLMGRGHAHQDKLNVCVWAYGREILFDGGGSSYAWDKWRVWSRGSLSHNCVAVDGLGQNRLNAVEGADPRTDADRVSQEPIKASWHSDAAYDFASAVYDDDYGTSEYDKRFTEAYAGLPGPQKRRIAVQRRSVLFVKPDLYIVADRMTPIDSEAHTYQARWHLHPTAIETDPATHAVTTADPGVPNLAVIPLLTQGLDVKTVSAQETPEILGWHCRKDVKPQNVPVTSVLHTVSGTGVKDFLTLLLPLRADQKNPVTAVKQQKGYVEVQFVDGKRLQVSSDNDGGIAVKELTKTGAVTRAVKGEVTDK